jgi:hypothetical protein
MPGIRLPGTGREVRNAIYLLTTVLYLVITLLPGTGNFFPLETRSELSVILWMWRE